MYLDVVLPILFSFLFNSFTLVSGLGSQCSGSLGAGTAGASDPYWLENITHQGTSAFGPSGYTVFRNVKNFGAKGDGVTDDTAAINSAISSGGRCGQGCNSSSTTPALVYFPQGKYVVSTPIIAFYYTAIVGDARNPPTLIASSGFTGMAVIDADPYIPGGGGAQYYVNTNNFYRSVRNFVIDVTRMPASSSATGIHWQVSQVTSLYNIVFQMSTASGNAHQGIWMENGSGGFIGDLVFNGGKFGIWAGNQQFTVRNITVNNANTAFYGLWNWGWTFQGVTINNCQIGFDLAIGTKDNSSQGIGAESIIDAVVTNTPLFVRTSQASNGVLHGSIVLNNIKLTNVPTAIGVTGGTVVLAGGTMTIDSWAQGNVYTGSNSAGTFTQGSIPSISKASSLLDSTGKIVSKGRPTYASYAVSQFVSVKSQGAKGDGNTDDTSALQAVFDKARITTFYTAPRSDIFNQFQYAGCKIIYFDAGTYIVSSTLKIPAGVQIVGEAWSAIMGSGSAFSNVNNPQVVVQVGAAGSTGVAEISDMLFTTRSPANGAIAVEWNVHDPSGQAAAAGMWDSLIRLGGAAGTNIETSQCGRTANTGDNCFAAFMGLHLTSGSSVYLEGTWVWLADHDVDGDGSSQITAYSGRGILSESQGPVWMIGTSAEHHTLYQYSLSGAANHYMGLIQTETPYFQPSPAPPTPFSSVTTYNDPIFSSEDAAWGLYVRDSSNILIFGAGHYSFYQNYVQTCIDTFNCQQQIVDIDSGSTISIYNLNTVGTAMQLSVNENPIIRESADTNGFSQTVTSWTQ
ncbi:hypothetical protein EW146_g4411 [Bondarzewia mesenterica]|uniref:Rhamnogalacturonase A/B/Epimerase-like pectate lyase domain-containing protein n=1 Tax=Bondarzewia mesenterica TaxID=1095465 RepID=A0A4V3XF54_9AGAM|nr:hypothetical protein EW146_g4411 [Bondarzewia mesenterica]